MISVCIATYNGEQFLKEQIDSILSQLSDKDEIIVSDDGSSDNTIRILRAFQDKRLKIITNTLGHGINKNFENAIRFASGEYIFLSDQDDVWLPNKIDVCLKYLKKYECIVHDCYVTDIDLKIKIGSMFDEFNYNTGFIRNLLRNGYTGCCMAFTRRVADIVIPIPNSSKFYHDQWIGLLSELKFNTYFIKEKLSYFRRHDRNNSFSARKSQRSFISRIKSRVLILKELIVH